jgi:predicted nucleic acid-binding protein
MIAYPDTSFLYAIYRLQDNSAQAAAFFKSMTEALHVSTILLYEFRQSIRFQVFRHMHNSAVGFPKAEGMKALIDMQTDLNNKVLALQPIDWSNVYPIAERLSAQHTMTTGQRAFDILHIATALHFGARDFLSFDSNQRQLAEAEGLQSKP